MQRVGDEVPVEAADVRRREAEVEPDAAGLQLGGQRAALELGRDRPRELAQRLGVVARPLVRLGVVDAEDADARAVDVDRHAEEAPTAAPDVGEHERPAVLERR